jgi:hypothetical protein
MTTALFIILFLYLAIDFCRSRVRHDEHATRSRLASEKLCILQADVYQTKHDSGRLDKTVKNLQERLDAIESDISLIRFEQDKQNKAVATALIGPEIIQKAMDDANCDRECGSCNSCGDKEL